MEAGLDSIGAVELRNAISEAFGVELSATATFDYPSAEALAKYIATKTGASGTDTSAWAQPSMVAVSAPARAAHVQQIAQELVDIVTGEPHAITLRQTLFLHMWQVPQLPDHWHTKAVICILPRMSVEECGDPLRVQGCLVLRSA